MTRAWKTIIAIGILALIAIVLWEFYQVSSGGRSTFSLSITPMVRDNLFSTQLKEKFENDQEFRSFADIPPVSNPLTDNLN
jgi:hypothetical protein